MTRRVLGMRGFLRILLQKLEIGVLNARHVSAGSRMRIKPCAPSNKLTDADFSKLWVGSARVFVFVPEAPGGGDLPSGRKAAEKPFTQISRERKRQHRSFDRGCGLNRAKRT
jgi:hypothetical protein